MAHHRAFDVAAWLLAETFQRAAEDEYGEEDFVTNMKLQKLLYYAQGTYLGITGSPLFDDAMVAWRHGPVVEEVYEAYKRFGSQPITETCGDFDVDSFTSDEEAILSDVMNEFGAYTARALRDKSHEETPWLEAISNGIGAPLDLETVERYFDDHYLETVNAD